MKLFTPAARHSKEKISHLNNGLLKDEALIYLLNASFFQLNSAH